MCYACSSNYFEDDDIDYDDDVLMSSLENGIQADGTAINDVQAKNTTANTATLTFPTFSPVIGQDDI